MTNNLQAEIAVTKFGARLQQRRKQLHLSQEALGVCIGLDESCSRARISRYENGVHEPDFSTAKLLATALSIPVVYLYCERNSIANLILAVNNLTDHEIEAITENILLKIRN